MHYKCYVRVATGFTLLVEWLSDFTRCSREWKDFPQLEHLRMRSTTAPFFLLNVTRFVPLRQAGHSIRYLRNQ